MRTSFLGKATWQKRFSRLIHHPLAGVTAALAVTGIALWILASADSRLHRSPFPPFILGPR